MKSALPPRVRSSVVGLSIAVASSAAAQSVDKATPVLPGPSLQMAQVLASPPTQAQAAPQPDTAKAEAGDAKGREKKRMHAKSSSTAQVSPDAEKVRELMQLSDAQLEQRIAELRQVLRHRPKNEPSRQTLGLISVEIANRILDLDALDRKEEIAHWTEVIRNELSDTFWRTTQLAKTEARGAAALGLYYSEGILTARAPAKACEQYARAAQQGHGAATYQAALCKLHTDPALAKNLLQRAAQEGHAGAQELLGRACIEGEHKDSACALKWLERAAAKGRPSAMSLLGWMYASDPEHMDIAKSLHYYGAAAKAGDLAAQNNLGELFETGRGIPQDAAEAFRWYARAAEAGFAPAELNLARMYAAGSGIGRDPERARHWAERAQKQGQAHAQEFLDWLAAKP